MTEGEESEWRVVVSIIERRRTVHVMASTKAEARRKAREAAWEFAGDPERCDVRVQSDPAVRTTP